MERKTEMSINEQMTSHIYCLMYRIEARLSNTAWRQYQCQSNRQVWHQPSINNILNQIINQLNEKIKNEETKE